jgi:hypothetical protein
MKISYPGSVGFASLGWVTVLAAVAAIFIIFLNINFQSITVNRIASTAFGIYVIHMSIPSKVLPFFCQAFENNVVIYSLAFGATLIFVSMIIEFARQAIVKYITSKRSAGNKNPDTSCP